MNINKTLRIALILPITIVWDVFFYIMKHIYKLCVYIDREGGIMIDKFVNGDES